MWEIFEEHDAVKVIDRLPPIVAEKYAFWCAIVRQSGPRGYEPSSRFTTRN
jgi:hypothetical protein